MSPVIAFDIAVVAQKVKSSIEDRCVSEKVGGGGWISSRSGWLLELLTELKNDHCKDKIFAQAPEEHSEGSLCWEEQQEVSRRDRGAFLLDAILVICLSAF